MAMPRGKCLRSLLPPRAEEKSCGCTFRGRPLDGSNVPASFGARVVFRTRPRCKNEAISQGAPREKRIGKANGVQESPQERRGGGQKGIERES